jgi:hypothetical protein
VQPLLGLIAFDFNDSLILADNNGVAFSEFALLG